MMMKTSRVVVEGVLYTVCRKSNQQRPAHEVIREDLILLIEQTRKPTLGRVRRPAPSHVASKGRAETQTRTSDRKARSLSTTLCGLLA